MHTGSYVSWTTKEHSTVNTWRLTDALGWTWKCSHISRTKDSLIVIGYDTRNQWICSQSGGWIRHKVITTFRQKFTRCIHIFFLLALNIGHNRHYHLINTSGMSSGFRVGSGWRIFSISSIFGFFTVGSSLSSSFSSSSSSTIVFVGVLGSSGLATSSSTSWMSSLRFGLPVSKKILTKTKNIYVLNWYPKYLNYLCLGWDTTSKGCQR